MFGVLFKFVKVSPANTVSNLKHLLQAVATIGNLINNVARNHQLDV